MTLFVQGVVSPLMPNRGVCGGFNKGETMNKKTWMAALVCLALTMIAVPTASAEMDVGGPLKEIYDRVIDDSCNGTVDPICWECDPQTGECTRCLLFFNPLTGGGCILDSPLFAGV